MHKKTSGSCPLGEPQSQLYGGWHMTQTTHPAPGYFEALGEFVDAFARAEEMARITMWSIARVDAIEARVIWPRLMVSTSIKTIRGLLAERGEILPPVFGEALMQLETLTSVRNTILHYGTYPDADDRLTTTDWRYGNPPKKLRQYIVSPALLRAMTHDVAIIISRLTTYFNAPSEPDQAEVWDKALVDAKSPFQYKP